MDAKQLADLLKRSETHQLIVGKHAGPYALGVTRAPEPNGGYAFLLKVADAKDFPESVTVDGETIPVIVQGGFQAPVPL